MEIQKPKNEKEAEVIALLKNKFLDEPHFINGIMMSLKNSDDCQSMIDEINNGNVATPEDAILFALQIEEDSPKGGS